MTTPTDVDLFADLPTSDSTSETAEEDRALSEPTDSDATDDSQASDSTDDESPILTVAQIPDGAMSVTEFAAHMTQTLMRQKIEAGEDLDMTEYVVPQAVYQTVKAQRDRIPHVIVKGENDAEGRVYILKTEATDWWLSRKERLATRGQGANRASSRTPEENLNLLGEAVKKSLYAVDRQMLWDERVEQTAKLVDKYKGFLNDAKMSEETVALAIQEATDAYNAEKAAKEAEKTKKTKTGATLSE